MKLEICRQIFEEYSNTKFHENPFNGSRVVAWGRTDKQVECTQTDRQNEANVRLSKLCKLT